MKQLNQLKNSIYSQIKHIDDKKIITETKDNNVIEVYCFNPKLLICSDDKKITFIKIPPYNKSTINNNENENIRRTIIIKDDITLQ